MSADYTYDYAVIRVVPRVERGEQVNAGVILSCADTDFLDARIELDEAAVLALDPAADLEAIRANLATIPLVCRGGAGAGPIGELPPRGRFRWITPGALVAAIAWFAASIGYGIYVGEISSYNSTYGAFAALVILLLWAWITSIAFLFGCEFDAVLAERQGDLKPDPAASTPQAPAP